jgi:CRISPR-associated protein Csc3
VNSEQLGLFDDDNDLPILDLDAGRTEDTEEIAQPELLTLRLFQQSIAETAGNEDDRILSNFAEHVLPKLMRHVLRSH